MLMFVWKLWATVRISGQISAITLISTLEFDTCPQYKNGFILRDSKSNQLIRYMIHE